MLRISIALAALLAAHSAAFAGSCWTTKGGGIGATEGIAQFMSNKALHNVQAQYGEKGIGKVTTTCTPGVIWNCVSAQKSCK